MIKSMTSNLMVEDVDVSIKFYKDILHFEQVLSVPNDEGKTQFAILSKDGLQLMFQQRKNMIKEYEVLQTDIVRASSSLYFNVDDFNGLYEQIKAKCDIYIDIHTTFYDSREFSIVDKDGYVLTFNDGQ